MTYVPTEATDIRPEDFTTSTQRVRDAAGKLLDNSEVARDAHRSLTEEIDLHQIRKQGTLAELRKASGMTQAQLAEALGMDQGDVSRVERRSNIQLITLCRYVEATGGSLRLTAVYNDLEFDLDIGPAEVVLAQ